MHTKSRNKTVSQRVERRRTDDAPRTIPQAAWELNLAPGTVRLWVSQRRIGFVRLGRCIRIPAKEIQRLLSRGFVPAEEEAKHDVA
jgi:excisionase family DNA binding protein